MIKHKVYTLGICLIFSIISYAGGGNGELLTSVNQHIKNGDTKKALKVLESGISNDKENYILLTKRAEIYHLMHRDDEALFEVQNVLERNPECCPALLLAAQLKYNQKEMDISLAYIDQAFASGPNPSIHKSLFALKGKILLHMGENRDAEECLMVASSSKDVPLKTMCDLAKALSLNDKMDEAIVVIESSIERHGIQMKSLVLAGAIQNKRGKYDEAINYLDLALSIDGENPTALASLAEAYMYIEDMPTAELKLKKAMESDESSSYAHKVYGDFLMKQKDPQAACGEYNLAVAYGYAEEYGQVEILFLLTETCGLD